MRPLSMLSAFIGGAIVGAGAALLFAPEKGEELRDNIKHYLKKTCGCKCSKNKDIGDYVGEIAEEIKN